MPDNLHNPGTRRSGNFSPSSGYHPMMLKRRSPYVPMVALLVVASCGGSARSAPAVAPLPEAGVRELTADQQAAQTVSRLTFGPRPGDVERVTAIGTDRWIERQLLPDGIGDAAVESVLRGLRVWPTQANILAASSPPQDVYLRNLRVVRGLAPNAQFQLSPEDSAQFKSMNDRGNKHVNQFLAAKVVRAQMSERQLVEVLTDFWENHFSVFAGKMPTRFTLLEYDRYVIRPHVLGKFRDLLGAVAHSSAMLYYLDNFQSAADSLHMTLPEFRQAEKTGRRPVNHRRNGLNENYGRELLELHTMGVDGGYTQTDVIAVARALTGWTLVDPRTGGGFIFREGMHDAEPKVVLGHTLRARRIMNASPDTSASTAFQIQRLGEQLFGHLAPNGWPETGDQWINAGSLLDRINFGVQVGGGRLRFAPAEQWPGWAVLSAMPLDRQVDGVVDQVLGGNASPETRSILFRGQNPLAAANTAAPVRPSLRDLLGIALGSPEFQRR